MEGRKQSATGQESEDFMKYFTKLDLSTAMNLTPEAMDVLLLSCGISSTRESLSKDEVRAIQHYLQQQSDGLSAQAQERLERTVEQYTVLVDTCSLLHYQFSAWMDWVSAGWSFSAPSLARHALTQQPQPRQS